MSRPILLDTCAAIWLANRSPLKGASLDEIRALQGTPRAILVSPVTAWEIGQLVSRGRIALPQLPGAWFREMLDAGVALAPLPVEVLIASSFLPAPVLRDPADRIVAATAREYGYRVMTRDAPLLAFAEAGQMQAIAC